MDDLPFDLFDFTDAISNHFDLDNKGAGKIPTLGAFLRYIEKN